MDTKIERKHHDPVVKPSKSTTELQIVYDTLTKAKRGDKRSNECLYRGPLLIPDLCGILCSVLESSQLYYYRYSESIYASRYSGV